MQFSCFFYRGYGESDHPEGRDQYKMSYLVNDIKEMVCWNLYSNCMDSNTTVLEWFSLECARKTKTKVITPDNTVNQSKLEVITGS